MRSGWFACASILLFGCSSGSKMTSSFAASGATGGSSGAAGATVGSSGHGGSESSTGKSGQSAVSTAGRATAGRSGAGAAAGTGGGYTASGADDAGTDAGFARIAHVFVIALENHDEGEIVGNTTDAPYINGELLPKYASSSNFVDRLALAVPSEPHYVYMEAGTNAFSDHTFSNDDAPSASNSTTETAHLSTQLDQRGVSWMSYQESIDATTGACPIQGSGYYQPKHDPFVFFQDVSGNPPSKSNTRCVDHHKEYSKLADDLKQGSVAGYNFITPNLCNDMHGQSGCPNSNTVRAGDDWLRQNLPPLIAYCDANDGVVFLIWDEGESTLTIPFLVLGTRVKPGYVSAIELDHGSLPKTVEVIFGLPTLDAVKSSKDFGDLFQPGAFP